ncbi:MAG: glycosyltransferase family 4 protein [Chloroflexi bacterium]|nr:glycosyltransferase family 4 protein [Chloroflexota bacterium]
MKILYFSRDYSPHDERFLTALSHTAHEIHFLRLSPGHPVEIPGGVNELTFDMPVSGGGLKDTSLTSELKRMLAELKPDVVHAGPLHGPAYIAALTGFLPLASMSWGADILHDGEENPADREKIKYTLDHSTVFICDCQAVVEKAVSSYGFPRQRIFLFPWGVDLEHFTPSGSATLRSELGWQDNFIFLSNRSFEPIYGVDVVMRAFITAEKQNPDIRLLLYGKGSQEKVIRQMASEAGVTDKIHFGGYLSRAELPGSYRSADVFLSASHCDGSSVSLMEALACGRPALVSDIPANLEWVHPGEQGWIFHDGKADEMAVRMLAASRGETLLEMGNRARFLTEEKADWHQNFPILLDAYEQARALHSPASVTMESGQ